MARRGVPGTLEYEAQAPEGTPLSAALCKRLGLPAGTRWGLPAGQRNSTGVDIEDSAKVN